MHSTSFSSVWLKCHNQNFMTEHGLINSVIYTAQKADCLDGTEWDVECCSCICCLYLYLLPGANKLISLTWWWYFLLAAKTIYTLFTCNPLMWELGGGRGGAVGGESRRGRQHVQVVSASVSRMYLHLCTPLCMPKRFQLLPFSLLWKSLKMQLKLLVVLMLAIMLLLWLLLLLISFVEW